MKGMADMGELIIKPSSIRCFDDWFRREDFGDKDQLERCWANAQNVAARDRKDASPSDFEQLRRLRKAAALCAIPYEALLADSKSKKWIAPKVWTAIKSAVDALREALTSVNNLRDEKPPHAATSMRSACVDAIKDLLAKEVNGHCRGAYSRAITELESVSIQEREEVKQ